MIFLANKEEILNDNFDIEDFSKELYEQLLEFNKGYYEAIIDCMKLEHKAIVNEDTNLLEDAKEGFFSKIVGYIRKFFEWIGKKIKELTEWIKKKFSFKKKKMEDIEKKINSLSPEEKEKANKKLNIIASNSEGEVILKKFNKQGTVILQDIVSNIINSAKEEANRLSKKDSTDYLDNHGTKGFYERTQILKLEGKIYTDSSDFIKDLKGKMVIEEKKNIIDLREEYKTLDDFKKFKSKWNEDSLSEENLRKGINSLTTLSKGKLEEFLNGIKNHGRGLETKIFESTSNTITLDITKINGKALEWLEETRSSNEKEFNSILAMYDKAVN